MVKQRDDLFITVPSYFRCPISLDVMDSPVTLSTGITYDRSSIQQWLDSGHDTCPATMQLLPSKDLVPNHTLRRLILLWSHHLHLHLPFSSSSAAAPYRDRILAALAGLQGDEERSLSEILLFSEESEDNRKFLADCADGLPETLLRILCSPGTRLPIAGLVVRVLEIILSRADDPEGWMISTMRSNLRWLDAVSSMLRGGLPKESKIAAVRIVKYYSTTEESKVVVAENEGLLHTILNQLCQSLSNQQLDSPLTEACLSCLIDLSPLKRVKMKLVDLNLIGTITKLLSIADLPVSLTEKALGLLEAVTSCREGRAGLDGECMEAMVQKLLKVSREATETSVRIAWVVCWLFGETAAKEALAKSNGLGKLLVVMQSECSPNVRRMCVDLVKVLRKCHNYGGYDKGDGRCWYSYDTKTTHIMPF